MTWDRLQCYQVNMSKDVYDLNRCNSYQEILDLKKNKTEYVRHLQAKINAYFDANFLEPVTDTHTDPYQDQFPIKFSF